MLLPGTHVVKVYGGFKYLCRECIWCTIFSQNANALFNFTQSSHTSHVVLIWNGETYPAYCNVSDLCILRVVLYNKGRNVSQGLEYIMKWVNHWYVVTASNKSMGGKINLIICNVALSRTKVMVLLF